MSLTLDPARRGVVGRQLVDDNDIHIADHVTLS
jgi:hypothetical protein